MIQNRPSLTFALASQFHVYLPWGPCPFSIVNSVLNVKALVGTFNQEKTLVGPSFEALVTSRCNGGTISDQAVSLVSSLNGHNHKYQR